MSRTGAPICVLGTRHSGLGDSNPGPLLSCNSWGGLKALLRKGKHLPPTTTTCLTQEDSCGSLHRLPRQQLYREQLSSLIKPQQPSESVPVSQLSALRPWSGVLEAAHPGPRPQRSTASYFIHSSVWWVPTQSSGTQQGGQCHRPCRPLPPSPRLTALDTWPQVSLPLGSPAQSSYRPAITPSHPQKAKGQPLGLVPKVLHSGSRGEAGSRLASPLLLFSWGP